MTDYLYLNKLIGAYFNQDYHLTAETIEGIMDDFLRSSSDATIAGLRKDIHRFLALGDGVVESEFETRYGNDFDPSLWDTTAKGFLIDIDRQIANVRNL